LVGVRAAAQRGDHAAALALLADLDHQHPKSGLVWQERGACYRELGDRSAAIAAYRRAVDLNDALAPSWQALRDLYRAAGQAADADYAAACLNRIVSLPPQLARGSSLLNEGQVEAAEDVVRDYLVRHGPHVEGMRLLAQMAIKLGVFDDAEFLLDNVL